MPSKAPKSLDARNGATMGAGFLAENDRVSLAVSVTVQVLPGGETLPGLRSFRVLAMGSGSNDT